MGEQSLCHITNKHSTKGYVLCSLALAVKQKHYKLILDLYSISFNGQSGPLLIQTSNILQSTESFYFHCTFYLFIQFQHFFYLFFLLQKTFTVYQRCLDKRTLREHTVCVSGDITCPKPAELRGFSIPGKRTNSSLNLAKTGKRQL